MLFFFFFFFADCAKNFNVVMHSDLCESIWCKLGVMTDFN